MQVNAASAAVGCGHAERDGVVLVHLVRQRRAPSTFPAHRPAPSSPIALPASERNRYAKRLRFRIIKIVGSVGRSGRRLVVRLAGGYPLLNAFVAAQQRIRTLARAPA